MAKYVSGHGTDLLTSANIYLGSSNNRYIVEKLSNYTLL